MGWTNTTEKLERRLARRDREISRLKRVIAKWKARPEPLHNTLEEKLTYLLGDSEQYFVNAKTKKCQRCGETKEHFYFDGKGHYCPSCSEITKIEARKRSADFGKIYRQNPDYKIRRLAQLKERISKEPIFALTRKMRSIIHASFKKKKFDKKGKTRTILGCDFGFLKKHIEDQFTEGMSWDNMGKWHIDHKTPLAIAKTIEEVIALNHYSNLRPLWALDNLRKGSKIL